MASCRRKLAQRRCVAAYGWRVTGEAPATVATFVRRREGALVWRASEPDRPDGETRRCASRVIAFPREGILAAPSLTQGGGKRRSLFTRPAERGTRSVPCRSSRRRRPTPMRCPHAVGSERTASSRVERCPTRARIARPTQPSRDVHPHVASRARFPHRASLVASPGGP